MTTKRATRNTAREPHITREPHVSEQEAREVAEAARETEWSRPSFVREIFSGVLRFDLIHPYPQDDPEEGQLARPFLERLETLLAKVDSDRIEREREILLCPGGRAVVAKETQHAPVFSGDQVSIPVAVPIAGSRADG